MYGARARVPMLKHLGLKKQGIDKLSLYCHKYVMEREEEGDLAIFAKPEYAEMYMSYYIRLWRGSKSKTVSQLETERMLAFSEKYFEILTQ